MARPAVFSRAFLRREPQRADALLGSVTAHPAAPWGIAGQLCATARHDRARDLHRIRAPTLVLHGERDLLVPVVRAHRLADGIPGADLHVFAGAGHAFEYERLEETFAVVCDWLGRRPPAESARRHAQRTVYYGLGLRDDSHAGNIHSPGTGFTR